MDATTGGGLVLALPTWVRWLLPVIGPVLVGIVKSVLGQFKDRIPAAVWPILSVVITTVFSALGISIDLSSLGFAAVAGLAGSTVRNYAVGRVETCKPA
jgi:hypothetical protein